MYPIIKERCDLLVAQCSEIPPARKQLLDAIANAIINEIQSNRQINLLYACTHNSRRSHLGQVWASVAIAYYDLHSISTHSAGTEATAIHPNTLSALSRAGCTVEQQSEGVVNPEFKIIFGEGLYSMHYSKTIHDPILPQENLIAIMTCADAEQNCPWIPGCLHKFATTYQDPKTYDDTIMCEEKYTERSNQIAMECLYMIGQVKQGLDSR